MFFKLDLISLKQFGSDARQLTIRRLLALQLPVLYSFAFSGGINDLINRWEARAPVKFIYARSSGMIHDFRIELVTHILTQLNLSFLRVLRSFPDENPGFKQNI